VTLNNEIYGENLFRRIMNIDLNLCFFCSDTKLLTAGGLSDQLPIFFKAFGMIMIVTHVLSSGFRPQNRTIAVVASAFIAIADA